MAKAIYITVWVEREKIGEAAHTEYLPTPGALAKRLEYLTEAGNVILSVIRWEGGSK